MPELINDKAALTVENLMELASRRSGLDDFGPGSFQEGLNILVTAMRKEAELSGAGIKAQSERLINSLIARLRKTDFLREHPEILKEEIDVAAVIVGLPRTGSTKFQRLLAASPKLTATYWWETIYPVPLPSEKSSLERIEMAETLVEQIMGAAENFDSIHPLNARAFDEELTLIEHSFASNMPESMMFVPSYGEWLLETDQSHAYDELIEYLKILQWQSSERTNQRWVLKSPHHLTATKTALDKFPAALMVVPHRSIQDVMPSWYSMVGSLSAAESDRPDLGKQQALHWTTRLDRCLQDMMAIRGQQPERFLDIGYKTLLKNPMDACSVAFDRMGMQLEETDRQAFENHLNENKRGDRPAHSYNLADYGVTLAELDGRFEYYAKEFRRYFD